MFKRRRSQCSNRPPINRLVERFIKPNNIDQCRIDWAWTLLVDDLARETATANLSLDLYIDNQYQATVFNLPALQANGSDSSLLSYQFDQSVPLATLADGNSRTFSIVVSATGAATSVPEPGTLSVMVLGLAGIASKPLT